MSKKKETWNEPARTKNKVYVVRLIYSDHVGGYAFIEEPRCFPGFREITKCFSSSSGFAWYDIIRSWEEYRQHFPHGLEDWLEIAAERPDFAFVDVGMFPEGYGRKWRNVLDALWNAADEWRDKAVDRFDPKELKNYW